MYMPNRTTWKTGLFVYLIFLLTASCSHNYNSDELDLGFYQWNMWPDEQARMDDQVPSCGWEEFHRGIGKLVRIPATFDEHFGEEENPGVMWFHCRFTLPELWEGRSIHLYVEGAGPLVDVILNEHPVEFHIEKPGPFELNISDQVYYTLDNHLAIKITDPDQGSDLHPFGILGKVVVKSKVNEAVSSD